MKLPASYSFSFYAPPAPPPQETNIVSLHLESHSPVSPGGSCTRGCFKRIPEGPTPHRARRPSDPLRPSQNAPRRQTQSTRKRLEASRRAAACVRACVSE